MCKVLLWFLQLVKANKSWLVYIVEFSDILRRYDIGRIALQMIKSFFSDIKQYVNYDTTKSDMLTQNP